MSQHLAFPVYLLLMSDSDAPMVYRTRRYRSALLLYTSRDHAERTVQFFGWQQLLPLEISSEAELLAWLMSRPLSDCQGIVWDMDFTGSTVKSAGEESIGVVLERLERTLRAAGGPFPAVAAKLVVHNRIELVHCSLCGQSWKEQYVQMSLAAEQSIAGHLCPQCLASSPREAGRRLLMCGQRLQNRYTRLSALRSLPPGSDDDLELRVALVRQQSANLRSLTAEIRTDSGILRQASHDLRRDWHRTLANTAKAVRDYRRLQRQSSSVAHTQTNGTLKQNDLRDVLQLGTRLAQTAAWGVSLAEAIQAERSCVHRQRPELSAGAIEQLVDSRYRDYLRTSA